MREVDVPQRAHARVVARAMTAAACSQSARRPGRCTRRRRGRAGGAGVDDHEHEVPKASAPPLQRAAVDEQGVSRRAAAEANWSMMPQLHADVLVLGPLAEAGRASRVGAGPAGPESAQRRPSPGPPRRRGRADGHRARQTPRSPASAGRHPPATRPRPRRTRSRPPGSGVVQVEPAASPVSSRVRRRSDRRSAATAMRTSRSTATGRTKPSL